MGLDQVIYADSQGEEAELARFRKVNSLHGWVETHLNNGNQTNLDYIPMTRKDLRNLQEDILACVYRGKDTMEPAEGFFFGSRNKDNNYYFDLGDLYARIDAIIERMDESDLDKVYYWSWW